MASALYLAMKNMPYTADVWRFLRLCVIFLPNELVIFTRDKTLGMGKSMGNGGTFRVILLV